MPGLDAFSHVSLTVPDAERSAEFYNSVLGTETVFAGEHLVIVARGPVMIAFCDHPEIVGTTFDPARVGLDHVALQVSSRAELEAWETSLLAAGVTCSPIETSPFGSHLNLKDPDNIAIELFAPGRATPEPTQTGGWPS
ncbi:VOC family protein [Kribbella sp. NPDC058693]|uniref:VOC family protein n=1 Tax=Kribbella sp. NPDC058693 TaxID=3346602 RepID=UPI0036579E1B